MDLEWSGLDMVEVKEDELGRAENFVPTAEPLNPYREGTIE